MAETAKIVNPSKTVILPDLDAAVHFDCPAESLAEFLQLHADKNYYVIAYINCSAGGRHSPILSARAGTRFRSSKCPAERNILFVPDQTWEQSWRRQVGNGPLAGPAMSTGITRDSISAIHERYPAAPVAAHPECTFAVRMLWTKSVRRR